MCCLGGGLDPAEERARANRTWTLGSEGRGNGHGQGEGDRRPTVRDVSALADGVAHGLEMVVGWSEEGWQNAVDRRADSKE